MGEVWFGFDKRLDRKVAIKFIRIDKLPDGKPDTMLTQRFVRESRITARLEHPGVPSVYDCGTVGDDLYLVMQLIDGCPVSALLDEVGHVPVAWVAAIGAQVCSVLAVAHTHSLVHRDLKPSNLMLCADGTVKVLDFGVAAALASNETRLTMTGMALGTPEYMAPEQALSATTSPQSDLYSLGVILDELLTGENQFAGATRLAAMRNHIDLAPRSPGACRPAVPKGLDHLILQMLAKKPENRPASAVEVYDRLMEFCGDLPAFPGYVDMAAAHPVRMYSAVVGRIAPSVREAVSPPSKPERVPMPAQTVRASDIALARSDARALIAESRFTQAADLLAAIVEPAGQTFGAQDSSVINLRLELADALFLGGDYSRAASAFGKLAEDLAVRDGAGNDLALRCRQQQATCHAALGESSLALSKLNALLKDERRFGADEDRILELREQIGLLEFGSGNPSRAASTLKALLPDLERRHGAGHLKVARIREILATVDS